jgi:hypothetical protein
MTDWPVPHLFHGTLYLIMIVICVGIIHGPIVDPTVSVHFFKILGIHAGQHTHAIKVIASAGV